MQICTAPSAAMSCYFCMVVNLEHILVCSSSCVYSFADTYSVEFRYIHTYILYAS